MLTCRLFNNNTGGALWLYIDKNANLLNECLKKCIDAYGYFCHDFWGKHKDDNLLEENYKTLTKQNDR